MIGFFLFGLFILFAIPVSMTLSCYSPFSTMASQYPCTNQSSRCPVFLLDFDVTDKKMQMELPVVVVTKNASAVAVLHILFILMMDKQA